MAAIADIGKEKDPNAVPPLLNALKTLEATVRKEAVTAMGWLKAAVCTDAFGV